MNSMPNHSVEAHRRPAAPLDVSSQFGAAFSARPDFPAAVAHLGRSATVPTCLLQAAVSGKFLA